MTEFAWRPRIERFRRLSVRRLVRKHGYSQESAEEMVYKIGDGTIIQWIIDHQDQILAVIKFVLMLIALFAATGPEEDDETALDAIP